MLNRLRPDEDVLLAISSEVAIVCDGAGIIRWADARAERLLGVGPDVAFVALIAPGTEDKARRLLDMARAAETDTWELVVMIDQRPVLMAWRGAPVPGGAALVGSLMPQRYAAIQDQVSEVLADLAAVQRETERQRRRITRAHAENEELLRAERSARRQVEAERLRLQQVLDSLPEGIVIVDADGRFAVANAAATEMLGLELTGRRMPAGQEPAFGARGLDGAPIPARQLPAQRSALDGEVIRGEQLVIQHARDGRAVPLLVNSAPLHGSEGQLAGAVTVFQDISAIKDLEREKDEFLATVSHDLRNPLAGIKGWIQILRRRARRLPEEHRDQWQQDLATVDTAAARMAAIIDELTDLTQLQMGRPLELHRAQTDLVELVARVVAEHQQPAHKHALRVRSAAQTLEGFWDANRLGRVIGNLVSNAIKYSPDGGEITITIGQERDEQAAWAVLSIQDQGIGIPEQDVSRIFERFYRASNATTRFAGTGIGLAGARQLVELHGGTIEVRSRAGVGSTFTVRLPLSAPPLQTAAGT